MKLYLHSGNFHADDVFCCAFLRLYGMEPETYRVPEVTEEMKREALAGDAIIADIGGIYDPKRNMFDHHQYNAPVRKDGTRYAAFGLLVQHFWKDEWTWKERFENEYVRPLDATDNGQGNFVISKLIKAFVPNWNSDEDMDTAFFKAVDFAYGILERDFARRAAIREAEIEIEARAYEAKDGILILDQYIPFDSCLDSSMGVKTVIYPSNRSGYDCRIVSIEAGRKEMVGTFHRLRAGAGGCTFLHKDGFLASFDTLEHAVEAAKRVF